MTFVIDIKTRFIPDDRRVYMLFPGDGYRFYADMKEQSAVFFDIPGFPLPNADEDRNINDRDFVARLTMSERIKSWYRRGQPDSESPVRSLDQLATFHKTPSKVQLAGKIRNFYYEMKRGDVVIVPGPNSEDDVLFGEIIDDTVTDSISVARYGSEKIPARKIKWLARLPRSKAPIWLARKIGQPTVIQQIERSHLKNVFDIMYQRYHYDGQFVCKFSVTSAEFSTLDNFLFQQIILYIAALHEHGLENNIPTISTDSIATTVSRIAFSQDIPDQRINIQSPGDIVLYARNLIPLIAATIIALAPMCANSNPDTMTIQIINSADDSQSANECSADINREVLEDLNVMGYARWQELCALEHNTSSRTGLKTGIIVRDDGNI